MARSKKAKDSFEARNYVRVRISDLGDEPGCDAPRYAGVGLEFNVVSKGELRALKAALDSLLVKKINNPSLPDVYSIKTDDIVSLITSLNDAGIDERLRRGWGY